MKGLLLKESLTGTKVLDLLHITKTETWRVSHPTVDQPGTWTALSFETGDDQADAVAEAFSRVLKSRGWYINAETETHEYVIFPGKVFKYRKGNRVQKKAAKRYGRSIDIPDDQLDW